MYCGVPSEPRLRDPLAAGIRDRQRDPEISDERLPLVEQDVLRLQVAMDDAVAMRVIGALATAIPMFMASGIVSCLSRSSLCRSDSPST